jgi:hypothetical protein
VNLMGCCTAERMSYEPFTRRATDSPIETSSLVFRGVVPATSCKTLQRGWKSLSEGVSQVLPLHDYFFTDIEASQRSI